MTAKGPKWYLVTLQEPCGRGKPWLHRVSVLVYADSPRQANVRARRAYPLCFVWEGATVALGQKWVYSIKGEAHKGERL